MRLRDLDAEFLGNWRPDGSCSVMPSLDGAQAVIFQCPKCAAGKEHAPDGGFVGVHSILVSFANPRNAEVLPHTFDRNPRWTMSGTSLDDLTLTPSINLDVPSALPDSCKWHGFVTDGNAI